MRFHLKKESKTPLLSYLFTYKFTAKNCIDRLDLSEVWILVGYLLHNLLYVVGDLCPLSFIF